MHTAPRIVHSTAWFFCFSCSEEFISLCVKTEPDMMWTSLVSACLFRGSVIKNIDRYMRIVHVSIS